MHPASQLFRSPGHTFSRHCRDLSIETPIGRWNLVEAQPAPDLADVVESYWEGWGDIPPLVEKILPGTDVQLMFNLKGRHSVLEIDGKSSASNHTGGWLSGLQRRYLLIETHEGSHFVAARLKPWGAWRLVREPMREVSYRVPLLDELWGDSIHHLAQRLAEAPNLFARFDILEMHLRRHLDHRARHDSYVLEATARLQGSQGMLRIDSLCRDLGTSRVSLSRKFAEQVGLTPKTYARVVRITALMRKLAATKQHHWATLAADFGYHDQAHLNHDFQDFCGHTPIEYLRRAAPGGGALIEDPPQQLR